VSDEINIESDPELTVSREATSVDLTAVKAIPYQGPVEALNEQQWARLSALTLAQPMLLSRKAFGDTAPDVGDLIRLAEWVLSGVDLIDLRRSDD
jgi:hypothetical protein